MSTTMIFKKKPQPETEKNPIPTSTPANENKLDEALAVDIRLPRIIYTDHEHKHITLKESESRYRRLFETAKDGILILDGDTGRIMDANPFLQDMLGYSEKELIGRALWEIGAVKDIPASQEAMRELQKNEYIRYEDIPLQTKAGDRKHVEFVSNVYLVDGWRVIQCNIRDITDRKRAEAQVLATNDELTALVNELQWRDKQMQLMNRMNELLQSCITRDEAFRVITLSAADLFPGHNGSLAILPSRNENLVVVARWGEELIMEPIFSLDDCWSLRLGKIHEVIDWEAGLLCNHFIHPPQGGYFCLPLTVQGETLGVLSLIDNAVQKGEHPPGLKQLAVTVSETIKLSLSNLRLRDELRQQAIQDPLTGLFNRRYLDETLPRELNRAQRLNSPLCVVMLDIDGFKQFNDSFGHGPGDSLLCEFASVLREHLRKSDISCRYGGDEFVLVMPDSSIMDTQQRVEQIRVLLEELQHIQGGQQSLETITLSAGIAYMPDHGTTEIDLMKAADEAMYRAKQEGRNRVVVYQKPSQSMEMAAALG
ncbi:MAG: diguanylate cyclase [Anaerolineales bacterium]|nr:diguanylate cyclase [Anaerolineales bacterium]